MFEGRSPRSVPNVPAPSAAKSDPPTAPVRAPIAAKSAGMIDSVPWTPPDPGRAKASAEPGTDDAAGAEDVKDDDAVG